MRAPLFRAGLDLLPDEEVVDCFAGGGGASTGIEQAIGRPVDIAINHSQAAIAMHQANHPETRHFCEDIFAVDPAEIVRAARARGKRIGFCWFSPDCTHFSRAKGTKPKDGGIRGLAWVVINWAKVAAPRVIVLENVEEFQTWGPLDDEGQPIKERAGETFRQWLGELGACGYSIEFRSLVAADYGTPTTRKRLFLIARRDAAPIVWPSPTHGSGRAHAWRPASEIIDWTLPGQSIFGRKRPLAAATVNRIASGLRRYVFEAAHPFIVPLTHQGPRRVHGIDEPLRTVTAAHRGELALVEPFIVRHGHYSTITGAGLREGCGAGTFRGQQLGAPLATVCATNDKHLVMPFVTKHYGGMVGHRVERTLGTITAQDHHALTAAYVTKFYGTAVGSSCSAPLPTVTAGGGKGGGHLAAVRAFLLKYYGAGGQAQTQDLFGPLHTVTSRARFGLVMVHGEPYELVDITMRMLQPHELFAAQGFPPDYEIRPLLHGKPITKTQQTALAGNSVCREVAEAVTAANARAAA